MSKNIVYVGNKLSMTNKTLTTVESLSKLLRQQNYSVHSYSTQPNKVFRLFSMLFAIIMHRKSHYLLIDTYSTSAFWYAFLCGRLAYFLKLKYIPILHGGNLPIRLQKNPKLCKIFFSNAFINVSPSAYLYQSFKNYGYTNLKIIPNTITLKDYTYKERKQLSPKLLWVRSFAAFYNPILAIKVYKNLRTTYPDASLTMIGPQKDYSLLECKKYAQKNNLKVEFKGKMEKKEWIAYAKNFDIFLNTTNIDNTPVSIIEALALGIPVISTNVGGIPFLVQDNIHALLVNPNNEEEMRIAILRLLKDPLLSQKLSQNGRLLAKKYDWSVVRNQWIEIFK